MSLVYYFEESLRSLPNNPALSLLGKEYSFGHIQTARMEIEAALVDAGLVNGHRAIGLLAQKSFVAYSGLLAIMGSGNVYVPLTPSLPFKRLAFIVREADLAALIVEKALIDVALQLVSYGRFSFVVISAEESQACLLSGGPSNSVGLVLTSQIASYPPNPSNVRSNFLEDDAYLLFTSGTTGEPKAVPVTHTNVCACIDVLTKYFPIKSDDRLCQLAELTFDVSIGDIFSAWKGGACLCVPGAKHRLIPDEFVKREEITIWSSVPTVASSLQSLNLLQPGIFPSIRLSLFAGEVFSSILAKQWQKAAPNSIIVNLYGPTEASVYSTAFVFDDNSPPQTDRLPLGRVFDGFDHRLIPVDGITDIAELYLAGPQVVRGYWKNESASNVAFVKIQGSDRVWYKTGDLVSCLEDGSLFFHGRYDRQVKVRGNRVELLEVEDVIRAISGADLVAVIPMIPEMGTCEGLIAFCNRSNLSEPQIRKECRDLLPAYMIPQRVLTLAEFPLSANGKIDYVRLLDLYVSIGK